MVTVDCAIAGHTVGFREEDLGGYVTDRACNRSDSYLAKIFQHGIPCQDKNRPLFIRLSKLVPTDFPVFHSSPQDCSVSQTENSSVATGCRAYPPRCLRSSCSRLWRASASRSAFLVKPERLVLSCFETRSTALTRSSSRVIWIVFINHPAVWILIAILIHISFLVNRFARPTPSSPGGERLSSPIPWNDLFSLIFMSARYFRSVGMSLVYVQQAGQEAQVGRSKLRR
jgi:hypothetical protein